MKKTIIILSLVLALVLLVACGDKNDEKAQTPQVPDSSGVSDPLANIPKPPAPSAPGPNLYLKDEIEERYTPSRRFVIAEGDIEKIVLFNNDTGARREIPAEQSDEIAWFIQRLNALEYKVVDQVPAPDPMEPATPGGNSNKLIMLYFNGNGYEGEKTLSVHLWSDGFWVEKEDRSIAKYSRLGNSLSALLELRSVMP
jgi:hypothetical protein